MNRFYYPHFIELNNHFRLPENMIRHIHVLRLRVNDDLVLFNGDGNDYLARLVHLEKRQAACVVYEKCAVQRESSLDIRLVQAISSGDKMDFTLQKSVELGVGEIQPIMSERCVVRLNGERAEKRVQRWQEIVIAACEQSGRNVVPLVKPILGFQDYLQQCSADRLYLLMSLNQGRNLRSFSVDLSTVELMIGPEGGWTDKEEQAAFDAGFQAITLGARVLRTETASLAAIAAMQTLWGDFC